MFLSNVQAEFLFRDDQLTFVSVYFDPKHKGRNGEYSEVVVTTLDKHLRSLYSFSRREESVEVPGAYRLIFANAGDVGRLLWVNLREPVEPVIIMSVYGLAAGKERQRQIEDREGKAFG
ncbi:MAG: hypothetical protein JW395_0048 [Nitrospira sp.]|nr:hypothetical protein [Nitrospira sp.]